MHRSPLYVVVLPVLALSTFVVRAQSLAPRSARPLASSIVIPQSRSFPTSRPGSVLRITGVAASVAIVQQAATTTLDIALENTGRQRREAELIVPVPDGAVVRGFTFQGAANEPTAQVLPRDVARRTYESIVAKIKDPSLLEFIGYNLIRTSVFPVEAGGRQKVRLTYENLLTADANRVDYVLPRSESLEYGVPWSITVRVESKDKISTVYSPSHNLTTTRLSDTKIAAQLAEGAGKEPGTFRLSYLLEQSEVSASLFAYPDPKIGGGYFLLLAGVPTKAKLADDADRIRREVTLVLDRSGSMSGEKLDQVRESAKQVIAGLDDGECFNILPYSNSVDMFAPKPIVKSSETEKTAFEYLSSIRASGGTNIHDALVEALRADPVLETLPLVLFLTDGLPTVGQTAEAAIREVARKHNPHQRRVFTFGVGVDVNTPLLDKIAVESRAVSTFVLPKEDVEVKVAGVFRRLSGPVLAAPKLATIAASGALVSDRIMDALPAKIPDLFAGDQLVLLGKYRGNDKLHFTLSGNYLGKERTFQFNFGLDKATTRHAFVPRLWASRQIGVLVEAIRELGASHDSLPAVNRSTAAAADPRLKELVDEIVRLSTEFGILTEYTAFLAREGTDLTKQSWVLDNALRQCQIRALMCRSGVESVNQEINKNRQLEQKRLNFFNGYLDSKMNAVAVTTVQQVSDLAFYRRGKQWIDSRLVTDEVKRKSARTIEFGSKEFLALARRLARDGRQGSISLRGDILLEIDGKPILIKAPAATAR